MEWNGLLKILVKVSIPRDQPNQNNEMTITYLVETMKSASSLTPPSTGLKGIQFSIFNP